MSEKTEISLYEIVLLWIGIVSALIILLLSIDKFSPSLVLISGTAIIILFIGIFRMRLIKDKRLNISLLAILLVALLLRSGIITHYMGGQDQGLYVNMSATMTRSGSLLFKDRLRESLPDELKSIYDSTLEPGVGSTDDPNESMYSIDFYPMHSAWMSCAKLLFGEGKHTISLLLFSLLGLIGMYLLTLELTEDDKRAGLITLLFGAINPVLVFFAKFPVGEMVALCFSLNGFYLLSKAFACENKRLRRIYLISSALLFSAFCYTRMTFPLLLPTLLLVLCITYFIKKYLYLRKDITIYIGSILVLFFLSWLFYFKHQYQLAYSMYVQTFEPLINKIGILPLVIILLLFGLTLLISQYGRYKIYISNFTEKVIHGLEKNVVFAFLGVILLSIPSLIHLFNDGLNNGRILVQSYPLIFRFHSLYRYILFISPTLMAVLLLMVFVRFKFKKVQILLVIFLATTWLAVLVQSPYILYLYYYGRYLTSEMVPYTFIMCGIVISAFLDKLKWRKITLVLTCITIVYFSIFSIIQMGKPESENPYALYQIDKLVNNNDVIIYENSTQRLSTPLKYYFDKQVFIINDKKTEERYATINYFFENSVINSGNTYGNIYLLEHTPLYIPEYGNSIQFVGKFDYSFGQLYSGSEYGTGYLNNIDTWKPLFLPFKYVTQNIPIYLYRINARLEPIKIPIDKFDIDFSQGGNSELFNLKGISGQERSMRWTVGDKATISSQISALQKQISSCKLKITAEAYTGGKPTQRFGIKVNGVEIGWQDSSGGEFIFDIPTEIISGAESLEIEIITPDAHSPSSAGKSNDARILGLSLRRLQFIITYL